MTGDADPTQSFDVFAYLVERSRERTADVTGVRSPSRVETPSARLPSGAVRRGRLSSATDRPAPQSFQSLERPPDSTRPRISRCGEGVLPEAREVNRRAWLLRGLRPDFRFGDVIELAFKFHRISRPDGDQGFEHSSTRAPRRSKGAPTASNSSRDQPTPQQISSRPSDNTSRVARRRASWIGW